MGCIESLSEKREKLPSRPNQKGQQIPGSEARVVGARKKGWGGVFLSCVTHRETHMVKTL